MHPVLLGHKKSLPLLNCSGATQIKRERAFFGFKNSPVGIIQQSPWLGNDARASRLRRRESSGNSNFSRRQQVFGDAHSNLLALTPTIFAFISENGMIGG
jgi:hypothetical protein